MNLLELTRKWIHPSVQGLNYENRNGKSHFLSVASCAVGTSLKRVREDCKNENLKVRLVKTIE